MNKYEKQKENIREICNKLNDYINNSDGKITLVMMGDWGGVSTIHAKLLGAELTKYAQYDNAIGIEFMKKGAKKYAYKSYLYEGKSFAFFKGWVKSDYPLPQSFWGFDKNLFYNTVDGVKGEKIGEESERMYIEDLKNKGKVYLVVSSMHSQKYYNSEEELFQDYEENGRINNTINRYELQGTPKLKGLAGPMYDGEDKNGNAIIRYESSEVNRILSE